MKFQAKKLDLDLELTTLSGEEMTIKGPSAITAEKASVVLGKIIKEDESLKGKNAEQMLKIVVKSVVGIYGKDDVFWANNFDPSTLIEIRQWFVQTLTTVKKKD